MTPHATFDAVAATFAAVAATFGYCVERLHQRSVVPRRSDARGTVAWILWRRAGLSSPEVGRAMKIDHSTVITAVQRLERRMAADPALRALVEQAAAAAEGEPQPREIERLRAEVRRLKGELHDLAERIERGAT